MEIAYDKLPTNDAISGETGRWFHQTYDRRKAVLRTKFSITEEKPFWGRNFMTDESKESRFGDKISCFKKSKSNKKKFLCCFEHQNE